MTNTLDIYIRAHGSHSRDSNLLLCNYLEQNLKVYFYHDHGYAIGGQAADAIILKAIERIREPAWGWVYPREEDKSEIPDYSIYWYDDQPLNDDDLDETGDNSTKYTPPFIAGILAVGSDQKKDFGGQICVRLP